MRVDVAARNDLNLDSSHGVGDEVVNHLDGATGTVRGPLERPDPHGAGGRYLVAWDGGGESPVEGRLLHRRVRGLRRLAEIPRLSQPGSYEITIHLGYLERTLEDYARDYRMELEPDFQRGHVWSLEKRVRYVEFLLRGGKSARTIFFNCPAFSGSAGNDAPMVMLDGLQRLTAVRLFRAGEIAAFGQRFGEWTACDRRRMDAGPEMALRFNVNDLPTRAAVLRAYLDLNDGGVVHSREEIERVRALLAAETAA